MLKQKSYQLLLTTAIVLFLFPFAAFTSVKSMDDSGEKRPDILVIDVPHVDGHKEMPPVHFQHELHSRAVEGQCAKCHDQKDNKVVFKFKRIDDMEGQAFMDLYHDNCVACHSDMKKDGATGPMEGECRECHNADFNIGSSWKELAFNRSLHYRHESAKEIVSTVKDVDTNCNACHHGANEKTNQIFYAPGEESACVYCHKENNVKGVRSARKAAHDSCVGCHLVLKEKKADAGPVDCNGCHEASAQAKIKTLDEVPRLKRNQPDTVLLTGWTELGSDPEANQKTIAAHMKPVAFNHKTHEARNQSCKVCHHESLKKCDDCHTVKGEEKGGFIKLAGAMHNPGDPQSCIGCHNEKKKAKDCAGCHAQMPAKAFEDNNCESCHAVDATSQSPVVLKIEKAAGVLASEMLETAYTKVDLQNVPEVVPIDVIAKEYKASQFPHRMVVEAVFKKACNNSMARAFHGDELTLCAGCHHNSPASMNPPRCASCHDMTPDLATGKPGLKGAYHGQCITCHQKMEVASVLPTDCVKCHEKK